MNLYCDGGVIGHNPSEIGGTWAYCLVSDGVRTTFGSGVITPAHAELPAITNNLTEMLALVRGLQQVPSDWNGCICSDSQVTLGRVFLGWKWKNIPLWLHHEFQKERARLVRWPEITHQLLQGHPTKAELISGFGSRGYPVSVHNVWCDKACGEEAEKFMRDLRLCGMYGTFENEGVSR